MRETTRDAGTKVVLIPSTTALAGVSVNVRNLARLLRDANLLDTVVCSSPGWLEDQLQRENLPFHTLNLSYSIPYCIVSSVKLFQFLRERKSAHIVHLNGRFPTLIALPSMILLRRRCFVVTVHEFANTGTSGLFAWKRRLEVLAWKYLCDKISCASEDLKIEVVLQLGENYASKVMTIKNWIYPYHYKNSSETKAKSSIPKSKLRILAIGRLTHEKGFDILISALKLLEEKGHIMLCDIFGDGPEKERLLAQISNAGLGKRVSLRGAHSNVRSLLPQYDLLIIPSRKEAFGLVALEAYDAGIPVIASNIPGLRETVLPGKTGLLFEPDNPRALFCQMLRASESPKLTDRLVENGSDFVKIFYPSKVLLTQYLDYYGLKHIED